MRVTTDHWLDEATRDELPGGEIMSTRRFLVIHYTSGATAKSSIDFWRDPEAKGAEAHIVIDRDGTVYQTRPFNRVCDHVGASQWIDPKTGVQYNYINSCSIGIELANAGDSEALARRWTKLPLIEARHKRGGPVKQWEAYPLAQLAACERVSRALVQRYNLDDLLGHDDCAFRLVKGVRVFDRKSDPGPAFPMKSLRFACGFEDELQRMGK